MKKYVIDASIVLKSLLSENPGVAKKFENLLTETKTGNSELLTHPLVISEVANGLRFTIKDKSLAAKIFKTFLNLPLKVLTLSNIQHNKILKLSYELGTTTYDTSYHILAKSHAALFLTGDEDYFKKAKGLKGIELWN